MKLRNLNRILAQHDTIYASEIITDDFFDEEETANSSEADN